MIASGSAYQYEFMYMKNIVKSFLKSCVPRFQMFQFLGPARRTPAGWKAEAWAHWHEPANGQTRQLDLEHALLAAQPQELSDSESSESCVSTCQ